jgi:CheY-like chemotaxis protein
MSAVRKVLVVDDDPVVGRSFDRVLSARGYAVITAENGQEALNKLSGEKYDVVFTDIRMPGMNGLEVAERVKASQPWLPVVIVTGYGTEANEARAEAAGVSGFLHKPLSPAMIEYSTQQALRKKDAPVEPAAAAEATEAGAAPESAVAGGASALKNIALFIAAPFVGLAYLLAFPFVGLGMIAWMGAQAVARRNLAKKFGVIAKNVGLLIVSPFLGLAYVLLFPFIGLAILAWMGVRALVKRSGPE